MPLCCASLQKVLRHVVQLLERLGRADDELHRQADAARQRRRLEGDDPLRRRSSFSSCCTIGCSIVGGVALRWSHGFSTMPAMDWPGTSSWKTCSVSG